MHRDQFRHGLCFVYIDQEANQSGVNGNLLQMPGTREVLQ